MQKNNHVDTFKTIIYTFKYKVIGTYWHSKKKHKENV